MSEKPKKKPSFFTLKRWSSQQSVGDLSLSSPTPTQQMFKPGMQVTRPISLSTAESKPRKFSAGGVKELVQCALCLEILHKPKMLPCQHTFCYNCLKIYIADKAVVACPICRNKIQVLGKNFIEDLPSNLYIDTLLKMVGINDGGTTPETPPVTPTIVGLQSVDLFAGGARCNHCKSVCDNSDVSHCEHCKSKFCRICWCQHLDDLRTQIGSIVKQLDSAANRLEHKIEYFKDRCEHITKQINDTADKKINAILESKMELLEETALIQKEGDLAALALQTSLNEARDVAGNAMIANKETSDNEKVNTFMNLHQNALQLLSEISKWDAANVVFDMENFRIESDSSTPCDAESDEPLLEGAKEYDPMESEASLILHYRPKSSVDYLVKKCSAQSIIFMNLHQNALQLLSEISKWDAANVVFDMENFRIESDSSTPCDAESDEPLLEGAKEYDPMESEASLILHYRSRNFVPHYIWRKTSRPCGVGVSPWNNHLYICGMDSHSVIVVERTQAKIISRLSCEEMLCPVHIAFIKSLGEIYVTDKWKHCIHVFSKEGEFIRSIGQKGSRVGMFRSPEGIATDNTQNLIYVVDTGNDRVQVIQPDGKFVDQFGVALRHQGSQSASVWETKQVLCTELNAPTSVAVTADRVIILDSGNRRVKIYNKQDKNKITEFGSLGNRKGQFRQPEVLAVDPMGFILVGDSGNCRVQVFKPNGQLVRVFGRLGSEPGKFGWISGIHVTKQLDVIVSDTKNHSVHFF